MLEGGYMLIAFARQKALDHLKRALQASPLSIVKETMKCMTDMMNAMNVHHLLVAEAF